MFSDDRKKEETLLNILFDDIKQEDTRPTILLNNSEPEKTLWTMFLSNRKQEDTLLNMLLNTTLQENTQLQVWNKELSELQNSTLENVIIEQQASTQLRAENKLQRSILFSDKLSSLWSLCNKSTMQCSRCRPGWVEHDARCFFLSQEAERWEHARRMCLGMDGDLAVILSTEDQAFLTNLVFRFVTEHPQENFIAAWIGLKDIMATCLGLLRVLRFVRLECESVSVVCKNECICDVVMTSFLLYDHTTHSKKVGTLYVKCK
uniref:C-type lectin domain-containing protein n=1 Tax=Scophthalmus maximus TaxID=52904 RepID=A0A8D3DHZ2_SCOMX